MGDEEGPDKRVEWLKTQLTSAFKNVKLDKLDKALNTGENRNIVTEFLENADVGVLCFDEALTATAGQCCDNGADGPATVHGPQLALATCSMK